MLTQKGFVCCVWYLKALTLSKDFQLLQNWEVWNIRKLSRSQARIVFYHKKFEVDTPPPLCGATGSFWERVRKGLQSLCVKVIPLSLCPHENPAQQVLCSRCGYPLGRELAAQEPVLLFRYDRRRVPFTSSLGFSWSLCSIKPKSVSFSRQVCYASQSASELDLQGYLRQALRPFLHIGQLPPQRSKMF